MTKQPVGECFSFIDFSMLVLMYSDVFKYNESAESIAVTCAETYSTKLHRWQVDNNSAVT